VSSTAPREPAGQPVAPSGTAAACSATSTSQRTAQPAPHTSASAAGGQTGPTTAAVRPRTVAGATAGAASRFAGRETKLTVPDRPATRGAVAAPAAAVTATASASSGGQPRRRRRRDQPEANSTMAPVATTDSANPRSRARLWSRRSSTHTAPPSAGSAARGLPDASASNATAPMAAARTTLGLGRASTTNPARAIPATTACTRRSTARRRNGHRTPARMMATFAPETAVRCARPARRKSSTSTGSMARVSPTTSPGSRPAGRSSSTRPADSLNPSRRTPAARCSHPGSSSVVGGPRAETTATTSSPGRGTAVPTRARTGCPGRSSRQPSAGANRSTGARSR
jgi:hypothetical protein